MRACRGLVVDVHVCRTVQLAVRAVGEGPVNLFRAVKANGAIGGPIDGHAVTAVVKAGSCDVRLCAGEDRGAQPAGRVRHPGLPLRRRRPLDHAPNRPPRPQNPRDLRPRIRPPRRQTPSRRSDCDTHRPGQHCRPLEKDRHWVLFADWCTATGQQTLRPRPNPSFTFSTSSPPGRPPPAGASPPPTSPTATTVTRHRRPAPL